MSGKRTKKTDDSVPSKKIRVDEENVDISNLRRLQSGSSQVLTNSRAQQIDPLLKSGKITKICLKNFMCHSNFQVNLNSNINVFVGLNGSGKSAILTALAIGLGSKASSTSRSTSLKDLVKQGESSATIEITLTNNGIDSFEDDIYGKEITVVRHINGNSGASTYKIKSAAGRVVTTSRQDLTKLTLCLNIQVENPVLILNQDAARSFLKECDPKKLYTLFMKATQIEVIIEKLHSCLKSASTSTSQLEHLNRSINQYENEIFVIREKQQKLQSVQRLRREIVVFRNELDWLQVTKVEAKVAEEEATLKTIREQINKIMELVKNKGKYDRQLKERIRDYGTDFARLTEVVDEKDRAAEVCRKDHEKVKCEFSSFQSIHGTLLDRKQQCDQNVRQLEDDIAERENNPLNVDNMRKENEVKIRALQKKQEDLALIQNNARRDLEQFSETFTDLREKIENVKQHHDKTKEMLQNCEQKKRQLEGSTKDSLSAYGHSMSRLINQLEGMHKSGRLAEMPRGPMGRYIEVPEKKFRSAVENILEGFLTSFFVSCDKDRIVLTQVLKEYPEYSRLSIITGAFHHQVYDVRNGMARLDSGDGRVLMDVIKVSDPVVMNCLIDQKHIETVVLVDSTDTAIELTQDVHNVPQNLHRVVLLNPFSEYYPAPNYRSYALTEKPVRYIQTSFRDVIASIDHQKQEFEEKLRKLSDAVKQLQAGAKEKEQLVRTKKQLVIELQQKELHYVQQFNELKSIEYPPENEIEFLRKEIEDLVKRQNALNKKVNESEEKLNENKAVCVEKEQLLMQRRQEARDARNQMTKIQVDIETAQEQLNEMSNDIKLKSNQLNDFKTTEARHVSNVDQYKESISELSKKPTGARVANERSDDEIQKLIRANEHRIQNVEAHKETLQDVELLLDNKLEQVDKMKKIQGALDQVLKTLEKIRLSRFHYIKRLQQHMSLRCKHKFNVLMSLRNYNAEVVIDHKTKTLELKVIPRDAGVSNAVSNTKSLSGGERSYSTVAFLISLWSCVDHPFYFLDEYDVFSDEHNRHMMTKLLLNEADKKKNKQYGFLTPQDFSNIEASDTITIHKLQDPERKN